MRIHLNSCFGYRDLAGLRHVALVSRSFFDEAGNSLPVISAFDKYTRPAPKNNGQ